MKFSNFPLLPTHIHAIEFNSTEASSNLSLCVYFIIMDTQKVFQHPTRRNSNPQGEEAPDTPKLKPMVMSPLLF